MRAREASPARNDPNARLKTHLWSWEYNEARLGTNIQGATPFWRAAYAQDLEMMKVLVAAGADPHLPTLTPPIEMRENRQQDGRQEDSFSGVDAPYIPEGVPALFVEGLRPRTFGRAADEIERFGELGRRLKAFGAIAVARTREPSVEAGRNFGV